MFIPTSSLTPAEYFTVKSVKSGQEMDLAPITKINYTRYEFFLYFSGLSMGVRTHWIRRWKKTAWSLHRVW